MKLFKLDTPNIQALYSAKLHDGLKPSSVRYIHAILHRGLSKAVELRLISRNPAASADPSKVRHEEITPLSMDQTRVLLDAARGQKYGALYVLSLTCGLRMGESLGLKWSDINLDAGTLRVNRQLHRIREGGGLVFSEPKNASRRTIDLPRRAIETLRLHSKRQAEERLRATDYEDSRLIFATRKGTPLDAQNVIRGCFKTVGLGIQGRQARGANWETLAAYRPLSIPEPVSFTRVLKCALSRHFRPLLKRACLPPIRWHDLRHTCATLLLGRGVHPKLV